MPQTSDRAKSFPARRIDSVEPKRQNAQWLIEPLWSAAGVGVLGGAPRSLKTWLAVDLAIAVASGTMALGCFPARACGPVLFFGAEEEPSDLRARFEGVAAVHGLKLCDLPIFLLDVAQLYLDSAEHLLRLRKTIRKLAPLLLVLDPFVRLVRSTDENSAQDVSAVLGSLRAIQRDLGCAILLVHHMRKSPAAHLGEQLRGSGDFAAWSSSALFITQRADRRLLSIEHRNAPAPAPIRLWLEEKPYPHLCTGDPPPELTRQTVGHDERYTVVLQCLSPDRPHTTVELRETLKIRKATLIDILEDLKAKGLVIRERVGWCLPHDRLFEPQQPLETIPDRSG